MKKVALFLITIFCLLYALSLPVSANEEIDSNSMIDEYTNEIANNLDDDTKDILASFGLEEITADNVLNLSFSGILKSLKNMFTLSIKNQITSFFKMLAMIILLIIANSFKSDTYIFSKQLSDIFSIICIIVIASSINDSIYELVTAFDLTGKLLLTYVPILTVLLSVAGNVTSSILYNSSIVALSQVISAISENIIIPFISAYFALIIALSLNETVNSEKITASVNKAVITAISTATMLFTLLVSAKNILAKDMDGIIYKSGKYLISNFVPVIGPAISSIFSSIIGSISLVKSTVAVFAILCVTAINLPVIAELFASYISLHFISIIADSFGERRVGSIFDSFASGIKILMILVIFELVIVVISTGLVLTVKGEI